MNTIPVKVPIFLLVRLRLGGQSLTFRGDVSEDVRCGINDQNFEQICQFLVIVSVPWFDILVIRIGIGRYVSASVGTYTRYG
ncbi:hypothetical protein RHMOL_Rhmol10G0109200 [Rhododendron molle]|uniref:Uncharacterized protein n=1 Tax=Rhododendron molle TaxID=49168 RepID=A0ACC0M2B1_RHOML|nr:hypothetical protein RHMOL_Rhmol10G0109200 [Rhododendron molle]